MATQILAAATPQYQLPESHRLVIIAQSDYSQMSLEIENRRLQFLQIYDDEFGQKIISNASEFSCES